MPCPAQPPARPNVCMTQDAMLLPVMVRNKGKLNYSCAAFNPSIIWCSWPAWIEASLTG